MKEIDFISNLHKSTKRDYLARVNNKKFPKAKAAELAKKWDFEYKVKQSITNSDSKIIKIYKFKKKK